MQGHAGPCRAMHIKINQNRNAAKMVAICCHMLPYVAMIWCWQFLYFSDWVVPGPVGFRGIRGCFSLQTEVLMAQDFAVHRSPGETEEQRRWVAALYSEVNARPRTSQVSMTCWDNSSFSDCGFLWFFHGFSCLSLFKHQHCLMQDLLQHWYTTPVCSPGHLFSVVIGEDLWRHQGGNIAEVKPRSQNFWTGLPLYTLYTPKWR